VPEPVPEPVKGPVPEAVGGSDDGRGVGVGDGDGSGDGDGGELGEGDGSSLGDGDGDGEGDGSSLGDGFFAVPVVAAAAGSATQIAQSEAEGATTQRVDATKPATIGVLRWRRSLIRLRVLRGISLPSGAHGDPVTPYPAACGPNPGPSERCPALGLVRHRT
jgi:hypothetical protein